MNINNTRFKDPLSLIEFEATTRCNLRCFTCADSLKGKPDITLDLVKKVLDEVQPIGVSFTGGEPTLNKHLLAMVKYCSNKGYITQINTNGVELTKEMVDAFEVAGLGLWHFSRHHSSAHNAWIYQGMKPEQFQHVGNIIRYCTVIGKIDVNVETTLHIGNLGELLDIHDELWESNVLTHEVVPVMPSGRIKGNRFTIPLHMLYKTLKQFLERKHDIYVKVGCLPITPCTEYEDLWKFDGHKKVNFAICKEGFERLHIHNDGSIIICDQVYPLSETPIGNANTDSIWDIYNNNPIIQAWREKPVFCGDCYGDKCRNTCQGTQFEVGEDAMGMYGRHKDFGWKEFL